MANDLDPTDLPELPEIDAIGMEEDSGDDSTDHLAMANDLDPTDLPELPQLDPNQHLIVSDQEVNQTIILTHEELEAIKKENEFLREHAKELELLKETLGIIYMYIYILTHSSL